MGRRMIDGVLSTIIEPEVIIMSAAGSYPLARSLLVSSVAGVFLAVGTSATLDALTVRDPLLLSENWLSFILAATAWSVLFASLDALRRGANRRRGRGER